VAREKEHQRDEKAAEAAHLLHKHHGHANSVALFQVAIALGAVAALSRNRWIWFSSLVLGLAGTALFFITLLLRAPSAPPPDCNFFAAYR